MYSEANAAKSFNFPSQKYSWPLRIPVLASVTAPKSPVASAFALSLTLGDHAVLRREGSVLWGFAPVASTVSVTMDGVSLGAVPTGADGVWRITLPAMAPGGPHKFTFHCSDGSADLSLSDILFGDVFGCGGQSNMWFPVSDVFNSTEEAALADNYPDIRIMTVGAQQQAPPSPPDFTSLQQPWMLASSRTIPDFSAVCWFFAKRLMDTWKMAGVPAVPLGLISDNIGGTGIALWSSNVTLTACGSPNFEPASPNPNPSDGLLYSQLIRPLVTGPTLFTGWLWFQAEADSPPYGYNPKWYACMITSLITEWRTAMGGLKFWFGFTQLAPFWSGLDWGHGADGWQDIRNAQLATLALPNVGFASAVDIGDPQAPMGSYHPRNKQAVGYRLAASALNMVYGNATQQWRGPQLSTASISQANTDAGSTITVTAIFDFVQRGLSLRDYSCPTDLGVDSSVCSDYAVFVTPGEGAPSPKWSHLGEGFLGTAGVSCGVANHTVDSAKAACDAMPEGSAGCPHGCKGFTFVTNISNPDVALPTYFKSVLDFFPEINQSVNWQSYASDYEPRVRLPGTQAVLGQDGRSLSFTATTLRKGQQATAAGYGWATWPVSKLMNSDGLPMVPWLWQLSN